MNQSFNSTWLVALAETMAAGSPVAPRGERTLETFSRTVRVNMRTPVLTIPERKLNYKFMAAEAHWILSGDNTVAGIAPYNSQLAKFSDDGETFFGAYGPRIASQLDYIVQALIQDNVTRRAHLNIWRENPPTTRDYPCTVGMTFGLRPHQHSKEQLLNLQVFMRSSDLWLGLPYDVFNFSMLAHLVCCRLRDAGLDWVTPGELAVTAASSHLYEQRWAPAVKLVDDYHGGQQLILALKSQAWTPGELSRHEDFLLDTLATIKNGSGGHRWWEVGHETIS